VSGHRPSYQVVVVDHLVGGVEKRALQMGRFSPKRAQTFIEKHRARCTIARACADRCICRVLPALKNGGAW
jgi:hypothetical protein